MSAFEVEAARQLVRGVSWNTWHGVTAVKHGDRPLRWRHHGLGMWRPSCRSRCGSTSGTRASSHRAWCGPGGRTTTGSTSGPSSWSAPCATCGRTCARIDDRGELYDLHLSGVPHPSGPLAGGEGLRDPAREGAGSTRHTCRLLDGDERQVPGRSPPHASVLRQDPRGPDELQDPAPRLPHDRGRRSRRHRRAPEQLQRPARSCALRARLRRVRRVRHRARRVRGAPRTRRGRAARGRGRCRRDLTELRGERR